MTIILKLKYFIQFDHPFDDNAVISSVYHPCDCRLNETITGNTEYGKTNCHHQDLWVLSYA
jgi:hypothetical protein